MEESIRLSYQPGTNDEALVSPNSADDDPWRLMRVDDPAKEVDWQLVLSTSRADQPLVFATVHEFVKWVDRNGLREEYADILRQIEELGPGATVAKQDEAEGREKEQKRQELEAMVQKQNEEKLRELEPLERDDGLTPGTDEFFEEAVRRGILSSLIVYANIGCTPPWRPVTGYVPRLSVIGLANGARSCQSSGKSVLYNRDYGADPGVGGKFCVIDGVNQRRNQLEFLVRAASTQS